MSHLIRLLRAGGALPWGCHRYATEKCNELAPPHSSPLRRNLPLCDRAASEIEPGWVKSRHKQGSIQSPLPRSVSVAALDCRSLDRRPPLIMRFGYTTCKSPLCRPTFCKRNEPVFQWRPPKVKRCHDRKFACEYIGRKVEHGPSRYPKLTYSGEC